MNGKHGKFLQRLTARIRRPMFVLTALLSLLVVIGGIWVFTYRPPPLPTLTDRIEDEVRTVVVGEIARSASRNASKRLMALNRLLGRRRWALRASLRRFRKNMASEKTSEKDAEREVDRAERVLMEIARLREITRILKARLEFASPAGKSSAWNDGIKRLHGEMKRWPVSGRITPYKPTRPPHLWVGFAKGVWKGMAWPGMVVWNGLFRTNNEFSMLRRMFFPYRWISSFRLEYVLGLFVGIVGMGYWICWIGTRYNNVGVSYLGLFYFLYLINFGICMVGLKMGFLS